MPGESSAKLKQTEGDDFAIESVPEDETKRSGEASEGNLPDPHDSSQDVKQFRRLNAPTLSDQSKSCFKKSVWCMALENRCCKGH